MVLAQSVSWGYSQDVDWTCSIWRFDWGWRIHFQDDSLTCMLVGGLSSLPHGPLHRAIDMTWNDMMSSEQVIQEREQRGRHNTFLVLALAVTNGHSATFCSFKASHKVQPTHKGRGIRVHLLRKELWKNWRAYLQNPHKSIYAERNRSE